MRLRKSPGARNTRVRAKITAMLLSLVALWGFAAWVTVRDGWNLLEAGQIDETAGRPTKSLINMLQDERRLSLVQLGRPRGAVVPGLADQRERTDRLVASWRKSAKDAPGKITKNVADTRKRLDAIDAVRASIDAGTADRSSAAQVYNQAIDAAFGILVINAQLDDQEVAADGRALIALTRGRELLAREDAFLSGVIAEGRFGPGDLNRFAQAVGVQRYGLEEAYAQLAPDDREHYEEVTRGAAYSGVRSMEDRILAQRPRTVQRPGVTAAQWQAASKPLLNQLDQAIDKGGDAVVERAEPVGYGVLLRLVLVAGLGLVAVVASIVLAFTTARAIIRQLNRLRIAAEELADTRLPDVVARLGRGEKVDVAAQAPPLRFGDDEIGRVGKAFNRVQETAIAAAVQQAEQRAGFRKTLRNLAQRNQSLVNRQLQMIDRMERREDLAGKELEDLLRLDHLTTRARRNAENLVQLSGGQPTRVWRRPVPILDVIRAAVSEVENYERATFQRIDPAWLRGHAVIDVIRLLAELIENALSFSSPETTVEISGQTTPNGFAIAVEDKGLGLDPDRLEMANHMLAAPPEFDVAPEERLGLLVAGLIARRHSITTTLKRSPYGGVTAVVLLPDALFERAPEERPLVGAGARSNGAAGGTAGASGARDASSARPLAPAQDAPGRGNLAVLSSARPEGPALVALPSPGPSGDDGDGDGADGPDGADGDGADDGYLPLPTRPASADRAEDAPNGDRSPEPGGDGDDPRERGEAHGGDAPRPAAEPDGPAEATGEPAGASGEPAGEHGAEPDDDGVTPGGLPIRRPQESLAPALKTDAPLVAEEPEPEELVRSPEDVQRIMGAYQRGTLRGRADAQAQETGPQAAGARPPEDAAPEGAAPDADAPEDGAPEGGGSPRHD